jgi:dihydrofolate synthase / folylpolyglutamate synthase
VIHIAGTNGKGSTAAFLRAIAEAAGLSVHVLTSPHLVRFAERIRIAGRLIDEERLIELIGRVEAANAEAPIGFFEIATVIALLAFAETAADMTIVEVGLGGRFDATNVFERPAVTVITPIDYDHLEMLGPELSKIAWEKAGILRAGAPGVIARQPEEAMTIIEAEAAKVGAPLFVAGREFDAWEERGRLLVQTTDRLLDLPPPSLMGAHQIDNAGMAVSAALMFNDPRIDEAAIGRGLASAAWPARFQRLNTGPLGEAARRRGATLWLDGGHNPHAGRALAQTLAALAARDPRPLVMVVGMLDRKDASGFMAPFADLRPWVITTGFDAPNAADPVMLAQIATGLGLDADTAPGVEAAVARALSRPGQPAACADLRRAAFRGRGASPQPGDLARLRRGKTAGRLRSASRGSSAWAWRRPSWRPSGRP